ncbi:MAG: hypothetical protein PHD74_01990 [Candidatus Krumholzibacteria bacterium]|nr:hypothetical protein [Candidatus Krumholzibacteria bacterium]
MNAINARPTRLAAALALCFLAALPSVSCRYMERASPSSLEPERGTADSSLAVAARFVTEADDVPGFFTGQMSDSGIVAVRVTVRNDGPGPVLIHDANGFEAGPGFDGFALTANGLRCLPLHPREVLARLLGEKKAQRYRKHSPFGLATSALFPPMAVYLAYGEADIGRFYRPLSGKSLYPALEDGMFEPVRVESGAERSGYLYFAIPREARRDSCELITRACTPVGTPYSLRGCEFVFSRDELPFMQPTRVAVTDEGLVKPPNSCETPYGFLFAVANDATTGDRGLYLARVRSLDPESDSLWTLVTPITSKAASIADASCIGSLSACAINFKSKSKVYLMQCAEAPDVFEEQGFSRAIRHVFLYSGGAFVVTEDGFCHPYDGSSHSWGHGVKLGIDVDDTALLGDFVFAFLKNRDINICSAFGGAALARVEQHRLERRVHTVIGLLDGDLVLLARGRATCGDTISVFNGDARAETLGVALPGRVGAASTDGSSLIVQLEEGTVARILRGPQGTLDVTEVGYLPFKARAIKTASHGFIAIGETGAFSIGSIDSVSPGSVRMVEVSVKVQ